jgi:hypothetical protein
VTPEELAAGGILLEQPGDHHYLPPGADGKYPTFASPDDIILVTAGGHGAGWSAFIPSFVPCKHAVAVTRRVRPANEALPDCGPDMCDVALPDLSGIVARASG